MTFIKGQKPWNKDKKGLQVAWNKDMKMPIGWGYAKTSKKENERRKKISLAMQGNKRGLGHKKSKSVREQISKSRLERKNRLGYLNSLATRKKMSKAKKGKTAFNKGRKDWISDNGKESIRQATLKRLEDPRNHYNYQGGKSFEPYPIKFTNQLKLKIKTRDCFKCQLCGVFEKDYFQKLSIHHIDYNKQNCEDSNLTTLCRSCNAKVNHNRYYWTQYFKEKIIINITEISIVGDPKGKILYNAKSLK